MTMRKLGYSYDKIAKTLNISKAAAGKIGKSFEECGSTERKRRSGRPRCTSKREDSMIRRAVVRNPFLSSQEILSENRLQTSSRTVRRRLFRDFRLRSRIAAKKPLLNAVQREKRIAFCKKYKLWKKEDWQKVMFSDESTFSQFGTHLHRVRRPANERYNSRYTIKTIKHPQKIMVWGCFSASGRGTLHFMKQGETVNARKYIEVLEDRLSATMTIHGTTWFQQDGAPAHTAGTVRKWFQDHKINLLDWPGNSPDLNPIENLWELLKRKLAAKCPKNLQDVVFWLKYIWCHEVTPELCQRLANSMTDRITDVLHKKGHQTKY